MYCDGCNRELSEHSSSPRVTVHVDDDVLNVKPAEHQTESVCTKANTYCLYGVLQNMLLLQHGAQNAYLQTQSTLYDLPTCATETIKWNKK